MIIVCLHMLPVALEHGCGYTDFKKDFYLSDDVLTDDVFLL